MEKETEEKMKKVKTKTLCTLLAAASVMTAAGCSKKETAGTTEAPEETTVFATQKFSDELTYPDHIADYSEIHPGHEPGSVKGEEAKTLLNEVEMDVLHHSLDNYADITILFADPEKFGFDSTDVSWGQIKTEPDTEHIDSVLDRLYSIDYEDLDTDDRIFYDRIVYDYEETKYASQYSAFSYYDSILNPFTSLQSNLLFVLDIMNVTTLEEAENYILMLKDLDRYLDDILAYEEKRVELGFASQDEIYEQIAVSFDGLVAQKDNCFLYDSFEKKVNAIEGISDADKERLIKENEDTMKNIVFPEFEECAARIRALKGSGGLDGGICRFPGGDAYYAQKVRILSNSSKTMEENFTAADNKIRQIKADARVIAPDVVGDEELKDQYINHKYGSDQPEENVEMLYGLIKDDFPELHEHSYYFLDVPDELKDSFSPAAFLGYHLDEYDSNLLITNRSNVNGNFGITCAHEAYPGHMYQSVYTRSATSHPYMYISTVIGYKEGWAVYCEQYAFKYFGEEGSVRDLVKYDDAFNVVLWAIIDYGVNYKGWTAKDFASWYSDLQGTVITENAVKTMYYIVVADPGYGVKYGSGYIRTDEILSNAFANHPDATAKEIHQAYLDCLPGTYEQIEVNLEKNLAGK